MSRRATIRFGTIVQMKNKWLVIFAAAASLLAGCAGPDRAGSGQTRRAPKSAVDVFYLDETPRKKHTEIAALSFRGSRADQSKAFRYFVKEAKRLGADAVIIDAPRDNDLKAGRLGFGPDFLWTASAVVYHP